MLRRATSTLAIRSPLQQLSQFKRGFASLKQPILVDVVENIFGPGKKHSALQLLELYKIYPIYQFKNHKQAADWLLSTLELFAEPFGRQVPSFSHLRNHHPEILRVGQQLFSNDDAPKVSFKEGEFDLIFNDQPQITQPDFFASLKMIPKPRRIFCVGLKERAKEISILTRNLEIYRENFIPCVTRLHKSDSPHAMEKQLEMAHNIASDQLVHPDNVLLFSHNPQLAWLEPMYRDAFNKVGSRNIETFGDDLGSKESIEQVFSAFSCLAVANSLRIAKPAKAPEFKF